MRTVVRPSPALIVAVVALVAAVAGTALAGPGAQTSNVKNRKLAREVANAQITKRAPNLSVANAATLDGHPPADFLSSGRLRAFDVTLDGGESEVLATAGPLTLTGVCGQNSVPPVGGGAQDWFAMEISTSQNGALFDGFGAKRGQNAGDFLDTNTPSDQRIMAFFGFNPGQPYFENVSDDGAAIAPDGTKLFAGQDQLAIAFNQYGGVCRAFGNVTVQP